MFPFLTEPAKSCSDTDRYLLWIDRVGCWMLLLKNEVTIGGPGSTGEMSDISLMASLSRKHATLVRDGESYVLHAHSPTQLNGRPIYDRADMHDGYEIQLGLNTKLRFRTPTVMSGSARIEFASDHRPRHAVEGIVVMDDTCLLGPHGDNHVRCPGFSDTVLLYRKQGQLWCKTRGDLFIGGKPAAGSAAPLPPGAVAQGQDFRFRLEPVA